MALKISVGRKTLGWKEGSLGPTWYFHMSMQYMLSPNIRPVQETKVLPYYYTSLVYSGDIRLPMEGKHYK